MNTISVCSFHQAPLNSRSANSSVQHDSNNAVSCKNEYKLPGYNVSFGMAKIIRANKNVGCALSRSDRNAIRARYRDFQEAYNYSSENSYSEEPRQRLSTLIDSCSKNREALRYVVEDYETEVQNSAMCIARYVEELGSKCDNKEQKEDVLRDVLINTKNKNGKSVMQNAIESGDAEAVDTILRATDEFSSLQIALLLQGADSENCSIDCGNKELLTVLNETIYDLTARDKTVSVEDSINLLKQYEQLSDNSILDEENKGVLEALQDDSTEVEAPF